MKGTMVTASRPGHYITRNVSYYKKIQGQPGNGMSREGGEIGDDMIDDVPDERPEIIVRDNEVQERRYPDRDRRPAQRDQLKGTFMNKIYIV